VRATAITDSAVSTDRTAEPRTAIAQSIEKAAGKPVEKSRLADLRSLSRKQQESNQEPKIPRPRFNWKTRVLIPSVVLFGFVTLFSVTLYRELLPSPIVHAAPVVVKNVKGASAGAVTVQAAGWLEADPYRSYVTALTDGVVREVLVLESESVQKGQVVARLVDEDARLAMERLSAQVREREATLAAARADLAAAQTEWENPVERQRAVQAGTAQLAESKATLEQLSAEIALEEAQLIRAKSDHDRHVGLYSSNSISEAEMVRFRSQFLAQEAKLKATRMKHAAVRENIAKCEADLKAAKDHMALRSEERRKLGRSQAAVLQEEALLAQARTALAEAKLRLKRMEIRSPMNGVVMGRLTEPGSKVVIISDNPGSARVLSLYDPTRLQVRVDVPLAEAAKIGVGQAAEVTAEVLPDRTFSGTVTRVLHEANIQKNTLEVKVSIAAPDPHLRPEMLARVRFLAKVESDALNERKRVFVPEAAIQNKGGSTTTWVVGQLDGDRGIATSRSVKLGHTRNSGWVEVLEGLQPGELVITRTPVELAQGDRVRVQMD
jgi:HlyD family secretion protein